MKNSPKHPVVSIDVETTSLSPDGGMILSFAAVLNDPLLDVDDCPSLWSYIDMRPWYGGWIVGDPIALAMNAKALEKIGHGAGANPEHFGPLVRTWLRDECPDTRPGDFIATGKNMWKLDFRFRFLLKTPGFGQAFVDLFHHAVLDPGPMFWSEGNKVPSLPDCVLQATGKEIVPLHDPLEDAKNVLRCIRNR